MAGEAGRQVRLEIDLGGEQITLVRLTGSESFSQSFHFYIDVLAPLGEMDLLPHLGKPARVTAYEDNELQRHFHGIVVDGTFLEEIDGTGFVYRLTLRPRAFFHEQGKNFRIFQNKTVKAILEEVLSGCGITADFGKLKGTSRTRAYCVQYGESDFGFACRLMEEEGIYYFYAHGNDDHVLTLCAAPSAHQAGTAATLTYNATSGTVFNVDSAARTSNARKRFVQKWHERVSTGAEAKVILRDFDFQKPDTTLESQATSQSEHPDDTIEVYNFPGRFFVGSEGSALGSTILDARRANRRTFSGESQVGSLCCGSTFKLEKHPHTRFNGQYLITHVQHSISTEQFRSGMDHGDGHLVTFEAVPADTLWKAPLTTRRPVVFGPETAIVTGPAGEEIHVDEFARIKIKFHWDRIGELNDHSSCWVRVSQTGGLGNIIIPRVGHEVLVDFLDGDPDRPIVVGRVFNKSHMPVYPLPEHKAKALWRTKRYGAAGSYSGAKALDTGQPGANELRFDDKGGSEEVFLHAERNMNVRVRYIETHHVGLDQKIDIGQDRSEEVGRNELVKIGKNRKVEIGTDETAKIGNNLKTEIGTNEERKIGQSLKIKAGTKIEIEAGVEIKLIVGASKITLSQSGIKVEGITLKFEGQALAETQAPIVKTSGSAMVKVQGAIVMIN
jgi:type VI secretion system secreted protein VgrG